MKGIVMNTYEIRRNEFGGYYLWNTREEHALFNANGSVYVWRTRSGAISHAKRYCLTLVK